MVNRKDEIINVGIVGYGNLGRGVEMALAQNPDFRLKAIFTRRNVQDIQSDAKVVHISEMTRYKGIIDVMILCGGSATDLPAQAPEIAAHFNTVDSFDTHAMIPEYFNKLDVITKKAGTVGVMSVGWDPGLFSLNRLLAEAVLPKGKCYTFWGKGVSQGHSDAIRRIDGVRNAIQYTVPIKDALEKVRKGEDPELESADMHERVCYVVAEPGADNESIENQIKNMPYYFKGYKTTVNFITEEEFITNHGNMSHGGFIIRTGTTGNGTRQKIEFGLELDSNPEFTSSVLVAYARAAYRLSKDGQSGVKTVFDIPFSYLTPKSGEQLRKELL